MKEEEFKEEVKDTQEKITALFTPLQQTISDYQKALRNEIDRLKKLQLAQVR